MVKISICNEYECPRVISNWTNTGDCLGENDEVVKCGDGLQKQTRACKDGTTVKCTNIELERYISCHEAETDLQKCPGRFDL